MREEAAILVADGDLSYEQIAVRIGYARQTIAEWLKRPEFNQRVEQHREDFKREATRRGIADKFRRIASYQSDYEGTEVIIRERSADPTMAGVPGARSGLLVRAVKRIGAQTVELYRFDAALIGTRNELRKQIAQELGQWKEKSEVGSSDRLSELIEIARAGAVGLQP
ncbi:MAG TPA: hypothetical protein VMI94_27955 [Bryobacteraceae bacterium]|nr:hypothetical protein [Bryobacteraceae bacterium]